MHFRDILGLEHLKSHLMTTVDQGRIPHAQLFVGPEGCGKLAMAVAYAQYILCSSLKNEDSSLSDACNSKCDALAHPDMHFAFPVANTPRIKSHAVSNLFMEEWRQFVKEQPYGCLLYTSPSPRDS